MDLENLRAKLSNKPVVSSFNNMLSKFHLQMNNFYDFIVEPMQNRKSIEFRIVDSLIYV